MKPYNYAFLLLLLLSFSSLAQDKKADLADDEHFVYLHDGTLFKTGDYIEKKALFRYNYFYKNGDKIKWRDIKFHQNKKGYYGKTDTRYAIREEIGTIDLFYQMEESGGHVGSDGYYKSGGSSKSYYYAKGFGQLKNFTYKNLKEDLTVFPNSNFPDQEKIIVEYLELGKKRQKNKWIRLAAGTGVFIVGGIIWSQAQGGDIPGITPSNSQTNKKQERTGMIIAGVGFTGAVSALFIKKPFKSYRAALRAFNEVY